MVNEWVTAELGEVAAVRSGYAFKSSDWTPSGIPVVKIANVKGGRLEMSGCSFVSEATAAESGEFQLGAGDILISMTGYIGDVARVRNNNLPCVLNQRVGKFLVRDKNRLDANFLYTFLAWSETRQTIENLGYGSAQPNVSPSLIHKVEIPLPPLPTQRAIAHVLGTLDDLIELNRETNEILEEMARALFKSWFVDFDPIRAKLEGRPPAGMDAATAALFPDHFVDSELGQIPKGWEVVTLGSVLDVLETGRRPKGGVSGYSSGIPSVGAESINGIGVFDFSKTKFIPHEFYERITSGRVQSLDVLLYKDGGKPGEFRPRVGMFGYGFPFEEFCINEHVFRMRSDALGQHYLYFAIADERVLLDFANKGGKAAIPGINQTDVRSTLILVPPQSILQAFDKQASPICRSIIENFAESRDLATMRDTLLPKLLSGEISVPAAEELIAASK